MILPEVIYFYLNYFPNNHQPVSVSTYYKHSLYYYINPQPLLSSITDIEHPPQGIFTISDNTDTTLRLKWIKLGKNIYIIQFQTQICTNKRTV